VGRCSESRNPLEASKAGDTIGTFSLEALSGRVVLMAATERTLREVATMAILDRSGG
jgi:hypothetical protein